MAVINWVNLKSIYSVLNINKAAFDRNPHQNLRKVFLLYSPSGKICAVKALPVKHRQLRLTVKLKEDRRFLLELLKLSDDQSMKYLNLELEKLEFPTFEIFTVGSV